MVQGTSNTVTATTNSTSVRQFRVPSEGWYIEIENSVTGDTLVPELRDDPQIEQQVNGLPQLRIPVTRDEKWQTAAFEDAPLRAWYDGDPQPVDTLVEVQQSAGDTTLVAEGGSELKQRVEKSVTFADAHTVAETLVSNATSYTVNVDDPATSTDEVLMQRADNSSEWQSASPALPTPSDDPRYVTSGGALATREVALFTDAEDADSIVGGGWDLVFGDRFGQGTAREESGIGQLIEFDFSPDYEIPQSAIEARFRVQYYDGTHPGFDVRVDGSTVFSFSADDDPFATDDARWSSLSVSGSDIGTLTNSDTVTLAIEITSTASDSSKLFIDAVTVYDSRYTTVDSTETVTAGFSNGELLSTPYLHPQSIQTETADAAAINQVVGGRIDSVWDDIGNNQAIALSNDQGSTYPISASNSETVDGSFGSSSGQIRARLTQSYYDSGGGEVEFDAGQEVDLLEVFADQEDTPTLRDRSFDDRLITVLRTIANDNDIIFELRAVDDGPEYSFELCQPGQRTSDADPEVSAFDVSKSTADVIEKAVIRGGAQRIRQESVTSNYGTAVALAQDDLVEGSEAVYDGGTQFERGSDYEMDYLAGSITVLSGGSMSDSTTYNIDYTYKPVSSYAVPGVSDPKTVVRDLPAVQSEQSAGQVAYVLVQQFSSPVYSATVTIPDSAGWSVIDEIDPSQVPTAGARLQTKRIETSPGPTIIELASQESLGEFVSRIQQRLSQTETKV